MLDVLTAPFVQGPAVDPVAVAIRLAAALALGAIVAAIYRRTRGPAEVEPSFPSTLVLLAVLIAMVTQVIGDNVARAFSLVGALSIVRFRTVVRDTEDTAFVIFAVVVGMAIGASDPWVAVIGLAVTGLAAALYARRPAAPPAAGAASFVLEVKVGLGHDLPPILEVADGFLSARTLRAIGTAKQGTAVQAAYDVVLRPDRAADALIAAVNGRDGVHAVSLSRPGLTED